MLAFPECQATWHGIMGICPLLSGSSGPEGRLGATLKSCGRMALGGGTTCTRAQVFAFWEALTKQLFFRWGPVASVSPGPLLAMHILRPHPGPTESAPLRVGIGHLCFNQLSILKFDVRVMLASEWVRKCFLLFRFWNNLRGIDINASLIVW